MEWETISIQYINDKIFVSRIYKDLLQLNKINKSFLKTRHQSLNIHFTKEGI